MSLSELQEAAIIATLIDRVLAQGRFCGETLVQKSVFFLKELFHVPMSDRFHLYYHGPFSFDLSDRLQGMQADDFVKVRPHQGAATFLPGERFILLQRQFPQTIAQYGRQMRSVVEQLATRGIGQLEPLTTALFVTREQPDASVEERARKLQTVKLHVDFPVAIQSLQQIDGWIEQCASESK